TAAGMILGTAAYMSPEQARGKTVDKRADVWAFGCVLYEMLTGKRAFEGETVSDTLAAVLMKEPDWTALPAGTPAGVRRVLRKCLQRDAKLRLHDIADARLDLEELSGPGATGSLPFEERQAGPGPTLGRSAQTVSTRGSRKSLYLSWALAAAFAAAAGALALRARAPRSVPREPTAFAASIPAGDGLAYDDVPVLALSRDGRRLVYAAERGGARRLFLRSLSELEARPIEGAGGARSPFFSPDGQWLGFFAEGKLKKVQLTGGPAQTICDGVTAHRGASWAEDDSIVFSPEYATGLFRVSARGGKPEQLTKPDAGKGERTHRWPEVLPGGDAVLFTIGYANSPGNYDDAKVAILDRKSGKTRILIEGGSMARYVPSGHLLYVRARSVLAVPFDLARREVTGEPYPVPEKIAGDPSSGIAYFAVGGDGTLVFVPGGTASSDGKLVLADRKGALTELPLPPREYRYPRFSPDGRKIAFSVGGGRGGDDDVWVFETASGSLTRLTFNGSGFCPIWSRDGRRVAYASSRGKAEGIYARPGDGSGGEEWLFEDFTARLPSDWSLDGKTLIFTHPANEVWLASLTGDKKAEVFQPNSNAGVYSPDDRWIAYSAAGSAGSPSEIFVQAADGKGGKWQVTTDGSNLPVWTSKEVFFLHGGQIRSVEVQTQPTFKAGLPRTLFEGQFELRTAPLRNYDVTRDGQRFVFVRGGSEVGAKEVDVVLDWARELGRSAPGRKP
ncbi:MAG TPA: protein kinase, partial [Thermoanaerobaculia bacterium]|nr:protein kinase [Thermoanaerobaculia bacterium]